MKEKHTNKAKMLVLVFAIECLGIVNFANIKGNLHRYDQCSNIVFSLTIKNVKYETSLNPNDVI